MENRSVFQKLKGLLRLGFHHIPRFHVSHSLEFLKLSENNEIEDIRFSVPQDDDVMFHQIKVYDGAGNIKEIIPPVTYGEWKTKKIIAQTPRQWAYWNLAEKQRTS